MANLSPEVRERTNAAKRKYRKRPEVREQRNAYKRRYLRDNPEARKAEAERLRRYQLANPEQFRAYAMKRYAAQLNCEINDFTTAEWIDLLFEFDYCCAYCQAREVALEVEHLTPLKRGGNHTKSNIVPACRTCNGRKHTKTLFEFLSII